ncbi:MAG: hypothetical protein ABIJ18_03730 [archaeon]
MTIQEIIYNGLEKASLETVTKAYLSTRFSSGNFPILTNSTTPISIEFLELKKEDFRSYRDIGDGCLFCAGYQKALVNPHFQDISFLILIGRNAYNNAAGRLRRKTDQDLKSIYEELAHKFLIAAESLAKSFGNNLGEEHFLVLNTHFTKYRDKETLQILIDRNILLIDPSLGSN